jgi:hypothetical protein
MLEYNIFYDDKNYFFDMQKIYLAFLLILSGINILMPSVA